MTDVDALVKALQSDVDAHEVTGNGGMKRVQNMRDAIDALSASEAARIKAEREVERLWTALEPFAKHIDEMRFDIDNNGNPLPDDQAVGWVYVTNGDFRRARAALRREP